ncbi:MAG TPA: 5-methyltetrahydropteroyltriglutamate--homocysteine S-methyltransferase [Burkholderiales bacterium]
MRPPFRVEHIGSFLRPERLIQAARDRKAGRISDAEVRRLQDECVREIVTFQDAIGLPSITDGEFRRRSWSAGFIDAVEGFGLRDGTLSFKNESAVIGIASSPYAKAPLKRKQRIVADDYKFLKSVVRNGVPKVTMAAPDVMHYFLGPKSFETSVYPDREAYFEALTRIYREEIAELAKEGCTYLQLDDTALPCNCDAHAREDVKARGEDADELTDRYVRLFNDCVAKRPRDMTVATHLCRGNLKGAWMAEGGYEPIAEKLFNQLDASIYCLEYDTERAGDFAPLRFLPKGKRVILGLVSTKTPALESKDALKRKIEAAAKHAPLEQLGIGPQCGFSSGGGSGQAVTQDDTRRKLELVMEVADDVW